MEPKVAIYKNDAGWTDEPAYLAFVILPDGKFWEVRFSGETSESARNKALTLWNSERERFAKAEEKSEHHWAGTVWLTHKMTREKKRVDATVAAQMIDNGDWERGGPRSK